MSALKQIVHKQEQHAKHIRTNRLAKMKKKKIEMRALESNMFFHDRQRYRAGSST